MSFLAAVQAQKDVTGSTKQMKVSAEIFLNAGLSRMGHKTWNIMKLRISFSRPGKP